MKATIIVTDASGEEGTIINFPLESHLKVTELRDYLEQSLLWRTFHTKDHREVTITNIKGVQFK
jgi:hypothetical protein